MSDPKREKQIFEEAIEFDSLEARHQFLQQACGPDVDLLDRVGKLFQALEQAKDFLPENPEPQERTVRIANDTWVQPAAGNGICPAEGVGKQVGRYKLLRKIGEGGCGLVYMAEQLEPIRRQVALKIVKLGMDTRQVIARFEAERQTLAVMDHPNIAKVLDAGATSTGRSYFVMELVPGERITRFSDERKLSLSERLELFIQVCRAIQHAHQKGIIHRDIKPSNILVTLNGGVPVPMVIDFGIAKATAGNLTEATLFTRFEQFLGTPAYMSPEQAEVRGVDIDTRSDIYSLGVVLYELLTGRTPFDSKSLLEKGIEELILTLRQVEPPRPSACLGALDYADLQTVALSRRCEIPRLIHALRGDLDWVVMKCLEKDRARRYETANGLVRDIQRYLKNEPVAARPPSTAYRCQKLFRRNMLAFAAGGVVLATLLLGLGAATYGFIQANAGRYSAENARSAAQEQKMIAEAQRQLADQSARAAREEQQNTRKALARAQTALAEAAYREEDSLKMKVALEAVPNDLRDQTWSYLMEHADTSKTTFHQFLVGAASLPANPGVFAVAEAGSGISLIQASDGTILRKFELTPRQQEAFYQRGLSISPDGRRIAVGSLAKGGIAIYQLEDGLPLVEWEAPETDLLEFSPDGNRLLQSCSIDGVVCLWEAGTGELLWTLKSAARAVFDPKSSDVIATHRSELVVIDANTGRIIRFLCRLPATGYGMAIRPDGGMIVLGDNNGYVRGVDLKDGRIMFERPAHDHYIQAVQFTSDQSRFVTVSETKGFRQSIRVWDAETGTQLQAILGGTSKFESLCIHPVTDEVIVTGRISKIWALSGGKPKRILPGSMTAAFFGDDSMWLGRTAQFGVGMFTLEAANAQLPWRLDREAFSLIAASADQRVAALVQPGNATSHIQVVHHAAEAPRIAALISVGWAVSFARLSPAGERVMTFVPEGTCNGHFDTATGRSLPLPAQDDMVVMNDVAWADGARIVGAVTAHAQRGMPSSEEWLVLWDAATGRSLQKRRSTTLVNCLAPAHDGLHFAEGGDDKTIRIRDTATLSIQREFRAHDGAITALAWHPTRPLLASASADLTIKIWDLTSGRCLEELRGPMKPPVTLSFSRGGELLLSAGRDNTRVWESPILQAPPQLPR